MFMPGLTAMANAVALGRTQKTHSGLDFGSEYPVQRNVRQDVSFQHTNFVERKIGGVESLNERPVPNHASRICIQRVSRRGCQLRSTLNTENGQQLSLGHVEVEKVQFPERPDKVPEL